MLSQKVSASFQECGDSGTWTIHMFTYWRRPNHGGFYLHGRSNVKLNRHSATTNSVLLLVPRKKNGLTSYKLNSRYLPFMTVCVGDPFLLEIQALTLTSNSNNTTTLRASILLCTSKIVGDPFVHEIQDLTRTASIVHRAPL